MRKLIKVLGKLYGVGVLTFGLIGAFGNYLVEVTFCDKNIELDKRYAIKLVCKHVFGWPYYLVKNGKDIAEAIAAMTDYIKTEEWQESAIDSSVNFEKFMRKRELKKNCR